MAEIYGNSYNKIQQIVFFSCTNKQLFIKAYQMAHGLRNKNHELDFNIQARTEDVRENKKGKLIFKQEPRTEWERKGLKKPSTQNEEVSIWISDVVQESSSRFRLFRN